MDGGNTEASQLNAAPYHDGHDVTGQTCNLQDGDDVIEQTCQSSLDGNDGIAETCLDESEAPSQREARVQKRVQVAESIILYVGFFSLGMAVSVVGPTLLDLAAITRTDTKTVSSVFMARSLCGLAGAILAGFTITRMNVRLQLGVASLVVALTMITAPHCPEIVSLCVIFGISGVAVGYFDAGGNMALLKVWGEKNGPWMQALHCIFGLGALTGPLVAEPFLFTSPSNQSLSQPDTSDTFLNSTLHYNSTEPILMTEGYNIDLLSDLVTLNGTLNETEATAQYFPPETKIVWCYLIVGICNVISAALQFFMLFLTKEPISLCHGKTRGQNIKNNIQGEELLQNKSFSEKGFRIKIVILVFMFYLTYCTLELNYGNYLAAFAVKRLGWTKSAGAMVTSAFWATFTGGRALGIVLVKYISPVIILFTDIILSVLALLPLLYPGDLPPVILWICSVVLGFGISTIFATGITWTERYIKITSGIGSVFMVAGALGEFIGPLAIGTLFDIVGPQGFIYVLFSTACLLLILMSVMQHIALRHGPKRNEVKRDHEIREREALSQDANA